MSTLWDGPPEPATPLGRLRILGPHAGVRVSPYFLGGMSFGSAWDGFMGSMDKSSTFKLLDAFYAAGGNAIDTANNYQDEQSERWIGEWIQKRHQEDPNANFRDQIVIASKYTASYKAYVSGKNLSANMTGNHKKSMMTSLRDTLEKLQTDYLDILYVHFWDYTTSIEEVMDALDIVVRSGKVLYLGISDTPAWVVAAANTYARAHGKTPFVIYQGRWNVMIRDFEREILPMCKHFGLALCPWDVIGGGRLQSKKQMEERKSKGEGVRSLMGGPEQTEDEIKYSIVLTEIAEAHSVESPTAIAIAYLMQKAPYVFPLVGGRKVEHLEQNIRALTLKLTDEEMKKIEDVKHFEVGFPSDFSGGDPAENSDPKSFIKLQIGCVDHVPKPQPIQVERSDRANAPGPDSPYNT